MAGRHTRQRATASLFGPLATAVVVLALLVSGAFGALKLTEEKAAQTVGTMDVPQSTDPAPPADEPSPSVTSAAPTPTTSPKPKPSKTPEHASRGSVRAPASKKPTPAKTSSKPTENSDSGDVVGSGSCGASYYDEGQLTANGETFDPEALTAAHKTLAFNTRVRVTNPSNGKSVVVRINDRGPFVDGRCIDLSRAAFRAIANLSQGELTVKYEVLGN
ncbi:septal ring lytic transglycosylase RlpA family protein [Asanoa sp. WMMD1127]|uniref:septal ring lytic transglycosylase RlpA family protein n=1 Tax=Asanoa sp. WMMD1127 TaxID=3016107 RepID=UPI0024171AC9|nr:septal ring lytic transglycosylase RlpA family protein [Asanoa sp. WMMD1127]MDG4822274.1 septal ring lytic transglycosylase RlpA family protein [Asanoa sp. WMMD1127]